MFKKEEQIPVSFPKDGMDAGLFMQQGKMKIQTIL
jgi:hypothetical protein